MSGCTYYRNTCFQIQNNCILYKTYGLDDQSKKNYCEGLKQSDNTLCTFITSLGVCITQESSCSIYDVSAVSDRKLWCEKLIQTDGKSCTNINNSSKCSLKAYTCDQITASSQHDWDQILNNQCVYYNLKCYTIQSNCSSYVIPSNITNKQLYCKNMFDSSQKYCTGGTTNCGSPTIDCTDIQANGSNDSQKRIYCRDYKSSDGQMCGYSSGLNCEIEKNYCNVLEGATSQEYCEQRLDKCVYIQKTGKCVEQYLVQDCSTMLFQTSLTDQNRVSYCQSYHPNGNKCTWNNATENCESDTQQCNNFDATGQSDKRAFCLSKQVYNCSWRNGDASSFCRNFKCQDIDLAQSQSDCDSKLIGCSFYINSCFTLENNCDNYYALGNDNQLKQQFCNGIPTISNQKCTYLTDDYKCRLRDQCTNYNISTVTDKDNTCLGLYNAAGIQCIFVQGTTCNTIDKCETYTGLSDISNCTNLIDINKRKCLEGTTTCLTLTCERISGPSSQSDCEQQLKGQCFYNSTNSKCITISDCSSYKQSDWPQDSDSIQYCSTLVDKDGHYCTAQNSTSNQCKERSCSDKQFYQNSECQQWKSSCKSDGSKCIESSKPCSQLTGNSNSCKSYFDSDNLNYCVVVGGSDLTIGSCQSLSCYQNSTATSDSECQLYQNGCLTRGVGCIPNTAKCDEYRGTKDQCVKFKGYVSQTKSEICSGDQANTSQSKCRSRLCSDNITDDTDTLCQDFKASCVTNGQGCIDINASCSSYKGNQQQCSKFMGNNKTVYCWNSDIATSDQNCVDKQCIHIMGTSDQQCEQAFPKLLINDTLTLLCVSNGTNCIKNPAKCNDFVGDNITCPTFTAVIDGPCKGNQDNKVGNCSPRQCYDAPKSYNTDAQCQVFHPTCLTTGQGCMKFQSYDTNGLPTINCNSIVSKDICSSKLGCALANQCLNSVSSCSQLMTQAICSTTILANGKQCVYDLSINKCREFQCSDYFGIDDNNVCQKFSSDCTTNGNGCEIMKPCAQYYEQLSCQSAYSTDPINRCTWTEKGCRQRECKDLKGLTNSSCKSFLSGCITNGQNCVGPNYQCQDLLEKNCSTDYQGNPCLFYNNICYSYSKCEDMPFKTHNECQSFSQLCTSNEQNCIALNKCQNYTKQEACKIRVDGICGWNNDQCNLFKQCSDIMGTSTLICQQYSSLCVSDGAKCVEQNLCSLYNSQQLCENNNGLDGVCIWSENTCRLKQCEDLTTNTQTFTKCFNQLSPLQCTTNGTKCISLTKCEQYDEKSCYVGTDGPCIYKQPIDASSKTISCRLKQCQDVSGKTLDYCKSAFDSSYKQCVSNGSICVDYNYCEQYITKIACASGGKDGQCAFTPKAAQSNDGTCKLFTQCSDANHDKDACQSKSKYCQWISTELAKQCIPHTCLSYNSNNDCYPVPSLDLKSYITCARINNTCQEVQPATLDVDTCYVHSAFTYYWNTSSSKCVQCKIKTDNDSPPNTETTTEYSKLLYTSIIIYSLLY